jgi:hypothetical protein
MLCMEALSRFALGESQPERCRRSDVLNDILFAASASGDWRSLRESNPCFSLESAFVASIGVHPRLDNLFEINNLAYSRFVLSRAVSAWILKVY